MSKKLFTKVVSLSLAAAMVLSMAPVGASAAKKKKAKEVKPKTMKLTSKSKASKIKVGETKTIVATRKQKKTTAKVKYVKFTPKKTKNIGIKVTTSDDAVVSVEELSKGKYTYTGVTAGTATLTITSRAKTAKKKTLKAKLAVTVISPFRVTQTGAYTFTMSTADKLEKIDKKDIKVVQEGNDKPEVDNAVKTVTISKDKLSVDVELHVPFIDQQKYEVTFGKEKGSFVASVGAPKAININTQTAEVNKPTKIEFAVVDEKGMDVTRVLDPEKIVCEVETKSSFYDDKNRTITMWKVGDTAEVKVTYHSWIYDSKTGIEDTVDAKATISCVEKSKVVVTGIDKWTIADRILSWDTDEMKHTIAQGRNAKLWVRMKTSEGYVDNKKDASKFSFEKINTATLYTYEDGSIFATRPGTEYAKVTYFDGKVKYQYTLPVTVGAPAKATTLVLSQPWVVISANATNSFPTRNTIMILDQYGEAMAEGLGLPAWKKISGRDVMANIDNKHINAYDGKSKDGTVQIFRINATGEEGVGVYELALSELKISMTVNARKIGSDGYKLEASHREVDLNEINEGTSKTYMEEMASGIRLDFVSIGQGVDVGDANAEFKNQNWEYIKINGQKVSIGNKVVTKNEKGELLPPHSTTRDLSSWTYLVDQNMDGSLVFYAVKLVDGRYVVQTPVAGAYTVEVGKIDSKGKLRTMTETINVTGKMELPKRNSQYGIKYVQAIKMFANDVAGSMITYNATTFGGYSELQKDYAMVLRRNIKSGKSSVLLRNSEVLGKIEAAEWAKNKYYLDTAVFPNLVTENGDAVWVVIDKMDIPVEVVKPAKITDLELVKAATLLEGAKSAKSTATFKARGEFLENIDRTSVIAYATTDAVNKDKYMISFNFIKDDTAKQGKDAEGASIGYVEGTVQATIVLREKKADGTGDTNYTVAGGDAGTITYQYIVPSSGALTVATPTTGGNAITVEALPKVSELTITNRTSLTLEFDKDVDILQGIEDKSKYTLGVKGAISNSPIAGVDIESVALNADKKKVDITLKGTGLPEKKVEVKVKFTGLAANNEGTKEHDFRTAEMDVPAEIALEVTDATLVHKKPITKLKNANVVDSGAKQVVTVGPITAELAVEANLTELNVTFSADIHEKTLNAAPIILGKITLAETDDKKENEVTVKINNISVPANGKFLIQFTD